MTDFNRLYNLWGYFSSCGLLQVKKNTILEKRKLLMQADTVKIVKYENPTITSHDITTNKNNRLLTHRLKTFMMQSCKHVDEYRWNPHGATWHHQRRMTDLTTKRKGASSTLPMKFFLMDTTVLKKNCLSQLCPYSLPLSPPPPLHHSHSWLWHLLTVSVSQAVGGMQQPGKMWKKKGSNIPHKCPH